MNRYYTFYSLITFIAAAALSALSLYAWKRRTTPGATGFFWVMLISCGWMLFWALELVSLDITTKMIWNSIRYSFAIFISFTNLLFVFQLCGRYQMVRPHRLLLLAFVPIVGLLLIWTNPFHHLVWQNYQVYHAGTFLIPIRVYGMWFWVQTTYNQILTLISLLLLIHATITMPSPYRFQFALILTGVGCILVVDILWITHLVPGPGLYPFSAAVFGLLVAWALFRYRLFDLVPVAHHVLVQNMSDFLMVLDQHHRVVNLNPAAQQIIGIALSQAIGRPIHEIVPLDMPWNDYLQDKQVALVDISFPHNDHIYEAQTSPLRDRQGRLTGRVIVMRDITERKRMEQALRENEERFRMLAENAHHIIFRLNLVPERHFDYISPSVADITGYTQEDVYANPDFHFTAVHPESLPLLLKLRETDEPAIQSVILRYIRKDGGEIWVEHDQWAIYDGEGQRIAFEGVIRDITRRKRAEQQVVEHQHALTMFRERERLARELHDDLGQTFGYINIQLQAALDVLRSNDASQATTMIEQTIHASQDVLGDIHEFILSVQSSSTVQKDTPASAGQRMFLDVLSDYLQRFTLLFGIQTTLLLSPDQHIMSFAPVIEAHLLRIIQESLTNARKHANATHIEIHVDVESIPPGAVPYVDSSVNSERTDADWLIVTIEDDGQGFLLPASNSALLPGKQGYGLSSMRGRAEECGGTLTIDSFPSKGTKIIVQIPLRRGHDVVYHSFSVLLVDDNPLFLRGLSSLLTVRGFDVVGTANDGYEAIEQARLLQPDVILMDVQMPNCDGLEATRMLKQEMPDVRIVMLTVSDDETHLFESIKNGASGYLFKNLVGDDLCLLLRGLMQGEVPLSPGLAEKILHEFAQKSRDSRAEPSLGPNESADSQDSESSLGPNESAEFHTLSNFDVKVLTLAAKGHIYRDVGKMLYISERSVKRYMSEILKKLHQKSRADAIAYARQQGIIS
jgi:PAS domain S-box-containing protein